MQQLKRRSTKKTKKSVEKGKKRKQREEIEQQKEKTIRLTEKRSKLTHDINSEALVPYSNKPEVNKEEGMEKKDIKKYEKLTSRSSPASFVNTVTSFNENQKKRLKEMGFGALLDWKVSELPQRLSFWLVNNFDPVSCVFKMEEGKLLRLDELDVHLTLGIPKGTTEIKMPKSLEKAAPVQRWLRQFKNLAGTGKIPTTNEVCAKMAEERDGGEWFEKHFLVAFTSTVIESTPTGAANPKLLNMIDGIEDVSDINWCRLVIDSLVEFVTSHKKKGPIRFRGPLLFLVVSTLLHSLSTL